jgi:hypothetical protein
VLADARAKTSRPMTSDEPVRPLGPWMKHYADITDRKAHYSDRQFRSLVEVFTLALRMKGCLPPRRALAAREGEDVIDFLFSEGDLEEDASGMVRVHNWRSYQADPTAALRQSRHRNRYVTVTVTNSPSSSSTNGERNDVERTLGVQEKGDTRPLLEKVKDKDPSFRVPAVTPAPKPPPRKRSGLPYRSREARSDDPPRSRHSRDGRRGVRS